MKRVIGLTAILCLVGAATAQDKLLKDPIEILKKADAATKAVKTVRYEATYKGTGAAAARAPQIKGKVLIGGETSVSIQKFLYEGEFKAADGDELVRGKVGSDGKKFFLIDAKNKTVKKGEASYVLGRIGSTLRRLGMLEFVHPTPFTDEINGDKAELRGVKPIGGEKCYEIYVQYAQNQGESVWFFSTRDFLPRRVDRLMSGNDGQSGATVLTLSKLEVVNTPKADAFALVVPDGFETDTLAAPKRPERPKLLAVGTQAPDWSLSTPGGSSVSLSRLRGKVVVLDFWATWCGPCIKAMPDVQKLHEKYKGKKVAVLGVNTGERDGDPAAFMKDNNYTYGLLLKGDDVAKAYKVSSIPTFYVIGKDGKIAFNAVGFSPGTAEKIEKVIDEELKKQYEG